MPGEYLDLETETLPMLSDAEEITKSRNQEILLRRTVEKASDGESSGVISIGNHCELVMFPWASIKGKVDLHGR